jgi:hypothetical protein
MMWSRSARWDREHVIRLRLGRTMTGGAASPKGATPLPRSRTPRSPGRRFRSRRKGVTSVGSGQLERRPVDASARCPGRESKVRPDAPPVYRDAPAHLLVPSARPEAKGRAYPEANALHRAPSLRRPREAASAAGESARSASRTEGVNVRGPHRSGDREFPRRRAAAPQPRYALLPARASVSRQPSARGARRC